MEEMKDRIRKARKALNLTQDDVAQHIGSTPVAVGYWERGVNYPNGTNLLLLAEILKTTPQWLVSGQGPKHVDQQLGNTGAGPAIHGKYPLISSVQAGRWTDIVDNFSPGDAEDWIESTARLSKFAFALRVEGDSMVGPPGTKSVPEGSIIIVDPQIEPQNGSFVVAKLPGEDKAVFKKFVKDGPRCYLMPLNQAYRPIEIEDGCIIVGVVKRAELEL